ncbi:hypothetical protein [Chengkuizengella axinellae]|uniref:Uncharacterized protein n=1 Tax=Chengkuizengella axinellae TaxID=3064388 RepID=A0ABT9J422_9BACL|nr:hypothetical protein [Chengkuizengella sp. 2205SS18-9]MDP5276349.1 hypothetical protein [Chengkuizengella sp. 2205SS18-9]
MLDQKYKNIDLEKLAILLDKDPDSFECFLQVIKTLEKGINPPLKKTAGY